MRRVGPAEDKGPSFYVVWEAKPGVWESRAFWFVSQANHFAHLQAGCDKLAFVEMR